MTMREQFLEVVEKYDIDEVWVNFDEALDRPHLDDGDTYVIYKKDSYVGQRELSCANYDIMYTFAPILKDIDVEDPDTPDIGHICYMIIPGSDKDRMASFERIKNNGFRLLYSKEDGIVG